MDVKTPSVLPSYTITSAYTIKNTIDDIETKMLEENVNRVVLRLKGTFDLDEAIYMGFVPYALVLNDKSVPIELIIAHYIEQLTEEEEKLWFPSDTMQDVRASQNISYGNFGKYMYANL
jgi:hypothetical protein